MRVGVTGLVSSVLPLYTWSNSATSEELMDGKGRQELAGKWVKP